MREDVARKLLDSTNFPLAIGERGRVEDDADPEGLGRVRVRITKYHGGKRQTPKEALPWADVCYHGGGVYDSGSFDPPPIGAGVLCIFESGMPPRPIVVGVFYAKPVRDNLNPQEVLTTDGQPLYEETDGITTGAEPFLPPENETEAPADTFTGKATGELSPTTKVWHKSVKGHTIRIEDRDGMEYLQIIDRAGQVIEMSCPVTLDGNKGNAKRRGNRIATEDTAFIPEELDGERSTIRIIDCAGQEILMDTQSGSEKIELIASRKGGGRQKLILQGGTGDAYIALVSSDGSSVRVNAASEKAIILSDPKGNQIAWDTENNRIETVANALQTTIAGDSAVSIKGAQTYTAGDVEGSIRGNFDFSVINDLILAVVGTAGMMFGSALDINVMNTGLSGPNADHAFSLKTYLGAVKLWASAAMIPGTGGELNLDGITGSAELRANVATANVYGAAGVNVTSLGPATVNGTAGTTIGSGATEPLVKGTSLAAAANNLATALANPAVFLIGNMGAPVSVAPIAGFFATFAAAIGAPPVLSVLNKVG